MLSNLDLKKVYYYTICVIALFILIWGTIDLASASLGLITTRTSAALYEPPSEEGLPPAKGSESLDVYYQKKMLYDRLFDSLVRVIISGAIFAYSRYQVGKLEG